MIYVLTAIGLMIAATLAHHLGLTEAIADVLSHILQCNMCCTFWACMYVFYFPLDLPIYKAALLSVFSAYASHWFAIVLIVMQNIYDKLWQRMQKK